MRTGKLVILVRKFPGLQKGHECAISRKETVAFPAIQIEIRHASRVCGSGEDEHVVFLAGRIAVRAKYLYESRPEFRIPTVQIIGRIQGSTHARRKGKKGWILQP